jgi:hypothetical protein
MDLTGPITVKNYDQRMEAYGLKMGWEDNWPFLSRDPMIEGTADQGAWDLYFRDHLGGFPPTYRLFRDGVIRYLNMPEERPELFDPTYDPKLPFRRPG